MPTSKNGKPYFTDEQYDIARYESSALEYAMAQGYDLVASGNCYRLREHDSMVFTKNGRWYWNSRNLQGGAIEFMTQYEHKTQVEAVLILSGEKVQTQEAIPVYARKQEPQTEAKGVFLPPNRHGDNKRVFAYLTKSRGIDRELVSSLVVDGTLYESIPYHNAVFLLKDPEGQAVGAFLRSTSTLGGKSYRGMAKESDRTRGVFHFGGSREAKVACVFEACIDAMSYASLEKMGGHSDLEARHYVASCGAGTGNVIGFLRAHPNVDSVILCQDNDQAGHKAAADLAEQLRAMDYTVTRRVPNGKDFNDDLVEIRNKTAERRQLPVQPMVEAAGQAEPEAFECGMEFE